jgi:prepilin-type processing-associated H-X9-DG protein
MAQFARTPVADLYDTPAWTSHVSAGDSLITDPQTQLNAVGRHHPGSYGTNGHSYGGTANFIYVDGHVEKKNIAQTMGAGTAWEWGDRYFSISGNNTVR